MVTREAADNKQEELGRKNISINLCGCWSRGEQKRKQQADTNEMIRAADLELRVSRALSGRDSDAEFISGWKSQMEEKAAGVRASFQRDAKRASLVFPASILRQAKSARRAKRRSLLRRARIRAWHKSIATEDQDEGMLL